MVDLQKNSIRNWQRKKSSHQPAFCSVNNGRVHPAITPEGVLACLAGCCCATKCIGVLDAWDWGFPVPDTETGHTPADSQQTQRHQVQWACSIGISSHCSIAVCLSCCGSSFAWDGLPVASSFACQHRKAKGVLACCSWIAYMLELSAAHCCSCTADRV